ncbi:NDP-hexose 2,3-dehydratase family protein [Actinoplanes sp. NPDC048791]|uniref:NDP-hexose 2,3-dehydratase family protein n=1 Tax=Actinoplanes sp. NPDC048791 TaxID=3154623 RepID=UPI0033DF930A
MLPDALPRPRDHQDSRRLAERLGESLRIRRFSKMRTEAVPQWLRQRRESQEYEVSRCPLESLADWNLAPGTGDIVHRAGRFYAIAGLEAQAGDAPPRSQPVIVQPEIGILGVLAKEFDGVLHFLLQAKMEPGNVNVLQLSPTVQATRSNYQRAHGGRTPDYLEHFLATSGGIVHHDSLQSEQGSYYLHKRNRNIVVETTREVPVRDGFCWLTLGQVTDLSRLDNVLNMDARTVFSALAASGGGRLPTPFRDALARSLHEHRMLLSTPALLSWLTEARTNRTVRQRRVPLRQVAGWRHVDGELRPDDDTGLSVIGVDVRASTREVSHWNQPMITSAGTGLHAFVVKSFDGVAHVLVRAHTEPGTQDVAEIGPTVQTGPQMFADPRAEAEIRRYVLASPPARVHADCVLSEEGGRFYHVQNRYMIVEADAGFAPDLPPDYAWATLRQLADLVRFGNQLNIEARSLLCLLYGV